MIMDTKILKNILACMILSAGVFSCQRIVPEEITELVLSNCLTPVSLKASVVNDFDVRFSWTVGKDAEAYVLMGAADAEFTEILWQDTLSVTEVPYTKAMEAGTYYYRVQALAGDRGPSHWAYGEVSVKQPVCDAPTNLKVSVRNDCEVTLNWDVSRYDDSYDLEIASDEDFTEIHTSVSLTSDKVPYTLTLYDGTWYFRVKAVARRHKDSPWSVYADGIVIMKTQDLGVEETANCYVINGHGKYRLKAVKGCTGESVGIIDKAEILWEMSGTGGESVIAQVSAEGEDCLTFITAEPFREGNALIAAKDALGNILWSWHIWLVSDSVRNVDLGNDIVLMDRNIGETGTGSGAFSGMLYQWGRKDPFPGTPASYVSGQVDNAGVTVKNPTVLYGAKSGPEAGQGAQPYILGKGKVGDVSAGDYDYWGSISGGEKTMYDPCPAGYRVPHAFESSFDNSNSIEKTRFAFLGGLEYAGGTFDMSMDNGALLSFRPSGHILLNTSIDKWEEASEQVRNDGDAFFWTASRNNKRIAGCIRISGSDGAQFWGKAGDDTARYQAKNNAYPVRCEKIR